MQEEVKENKRFKISDRSLSSDKLFANPKLTPTVGAGGQYSVNVQKPQQTSWERLANGLSGMMAAGSAIQQSDVANEEAAGVTGADLSTEEIIQKQAEAKEAEGSIFKAGGFVDRLVRRGEASPSENPLLYSRGQRAAGNKIGLEEYNVLTTQRLKEAQQNYRDNRVGYTVESIQNQVRDELNDKYTIDDTFSMKRGFDNAISKFSAEQRVRDFEVKSNMDKVFGITDAADEVASVIVGSNTISQESVGDALEEVASRHNNLSAGDWDKALRMALSRSADRNTLETSAVINSFREGKFKGLKLGGLDATSVTFESTLDAIENEISTLDQKMERELKVSTSNDLDGMANEANAILNADLSEGMSLADLGIPVDHLPEDQRDMQFTDSKSMLEAWNESKKLLSKQKGNSDYSGEAYKQMQRVENSEANKATAAYGMVGTIMTRAWKATDPDFDKLESRSKQLSEAGLYSKPIYDKARVESLSVFDEITNGFGSDGVTIMVGDTPLKDLDQKGKQMYADRRLREIYTNTEGELSELEQKKALDEKKQQESKARDLSGDTDENLVRRSHSRFDTKSRSESMTNWQWSLAKMTSGASNSVESAKQVGHPNNRASGLSFIKESSELLNMKADPRYAFHKENSNQKWRLGILETIKGIGVSMDSIDSLSGNSLVLDGKVAVNVTPEALSLTPIIDAETEQDFRRAASKINSEFGSDVDWTDLKKATMLYKEIQKNKQTTK